MKGKTNYEDIINLPHHISSKRPQMSMLDRAAQFSPFAALTGYDLSLIHISEPTRLGMISYAVFCLKKKKKTPKKKKKKRPPTKQQL